MIANLARNYKYINKFLLIHLFHSESISKDYFKNNEFYLTLNFYLYYLFEYYVKKSPQSIKIIINYMNSNSLTFPKGINLFPKMFNNIIKEILNNDYLSINEKKYFLQKFNINIKEYNIFNTYEYLMNEKEFNNIINFQNLLLNKNNATQLKKKLISNKYKITIIIYCFEYRFLSQTINSILNQVNINIEIIVVYDNNDASNLKYIKNITNEYINIKIIYNKESKGIIYSNSIGVLNANGEYILSLQPGYTLAKENSLFSLYNLAYNYNLDILEFNILINRHNNIQNNSLSLYKCLHFDPNKDLNVIKSSNKTKDIDQEKELLFNKLIKANIYKTIIYKYKLYILNITIYNYYEDILLFLLNKNKLKIKHIDEFGIIQNKNNIEILDKFKSSNNNNQLIKDSIFYINYLFDNSNDTFLDKKFVFQEFVNILSLIYNKFSKFTNNPKLIKKFMNCKFINIEDKIELNFLYNSLVN